MKENKERKKHVHFREFFQGTKAKNTKTNERENLFVKLHYRIGFFTPVNIQFDQYSACTHSRYTT